MKFTMKLMSTNGLFRSGKIVCPCCGADRVYRTEATEDSETDSGKMTRIWFVGQDCGHEWEVVFQDWKDMTFVKVYVCEAQPEERPNYHEYLASPEWREKAEARKEAAGQRCQICNQSRDKVTLDAHHRTYERLGHELDEDLIVLCRKCHKLFHESGRLAKR